MHSFQILRRPVVTEKSTLLSEQGRYVFEVSKRATKHDIKRAVEDAFDVTVVRVHTMAVKGKRKRFGPKITTQRSWKKAIVTLTPGDSITLFEGV
jgi:large subunit ribosomal protein L23